MKCPNCGGKGKYKNGFDKVGSCYYCLGTGEVNDKCERNMTNEVWFCSLPTEEKARWLYDHYVNARADEYYGRQEKTLSEYQKWLVSVHRKIDGTKID